jgi:hypothetical protein
MVSTCTPKTAETPPMVAIATEQTVNAAWRRAVDVRGLERQVLRPAGGYRS